MGVFCGIYLDLPHITDSPVIRPVLMMSGITVILFFLSATIPPFAPVVAATAILAQWLSLSLIGKKWIDHHNRLPFMRQITVPLVIAIYCVGTMIFNRWCFDSFD